MTSLDRSQTHLFGMAIMGMAYGLVLVGCEHAEQKTAPQMASGGSGTTPTNSGGTSAAMGSGGASTSVGVGGTSGNGGAANGGAANGGAASGGAASGGAASSGAASGGESTASGGSTTTGSASGGTAAGGTTTQTVTTCASDIDCKSLGLLCDTAAKKCVQCLQTVDCTGGKACVAGVCGGTAGCTANADCATSVDGKVCDATRGRCVACVAAADCPNPATSECVRNVCVALTTCTNSLDCTSATMPVCNRSVTPGRCVQCVANADCVASGAGQVCSESLCRSSCSANSDCSSGLLCNTSVVPNFCAACAIHSDCPAAQYCSKGACVADICVGGTDQACVSNGIATCNAAGDGFGSPEACPSGQTCSVTASRASCGGGTTTPTTCSTDPGTVNPCTKIPAFSGTQLVDAKGDDFCGIPGYQLDFSLAAGVNNNKVEGGSVADFKQRAVAKVAWSAEAFHAYVEVFGTPVRSNTTADRPWDGDAIELMITTASSATGLTAEDKNALHIIANHGVAVTVKSDGTSGTHTQITDAAQFKGLQTSTGYVVELKVPWPGAPALASGTQMRFDMAMNVDTESVDPTVQGRDAQAVLAMTALTGNTSCGSTPGTPFCDDRLWCPTALE